jgi:hypothetical protein
MNQETEQFPEDSGLDRLLQRNASAGLEDLDDWQNRIITLDGAGDRACASFADG